MSLTKLGAPGMPTLEIFGASIVSVGSFNPAILSVDWFLTNGLIGEGDAESARARDDYVVSKQITKFQTEVVQVQAVNNQLSIGATGPVTPAIADVVEAVFSLLPHTPVSAIGLNFEAHFKFEDPRSYHGVGDVLAPKTIWNELFPGKDAGIADLTILVRDGTREEAKSAANNQRISVQPSAKIPLGIYFGINNHFSADASGQAFQHAKQFVSVVRDNWSERSESAKALFEQIISQALEVLPK